MATYLYNPTRWASYDSKSPYGAFHRYFFDKEKVSDPRKPLLDHLRAFGCKADILIGLKRDSQYRQKRRKVDAKAYISFVIGYKSTNIYTI